jgi:hypothetical protein
MKTIKLSVMERFMLPQLLPQQGGKIEMLLVNSIAATIEFTAAEVTEFGLQDAGNGNVTWTRTKERDTEFEFTAEQIEVLKKA